MSLKLWTINRVLRWTGIRLYIETEKVSVVLGDEGIEVERVVDTDIRIGFWWVGGPWTAQWKRLEPKQEDKPNG